jgi:hypothetical protein
MAQVRGQVALDETVIEDADLEQALERRQAQRDTVARASAKLRELDGVAKGHIARVVPDDVIGRVGRFRIERRAVPERHVEFDAKPGVRVRITPDSE